MTVAQNLIFLIIISQVLAAALLFLSYYTDRSTHEKLGKARFIAIPAFRKIVRLFRETDKPLAKAVYLFSLIFVIFSYVGIILLLIHLFWQITG